MNTTLSEILEMSFELKDRFVRTRTKAGKIEIIEWLTKVQDKTMIKKVETLKNQSIKSSYEAKLKPMSSKAYRTMLENSEEDYKGNKPAGIRERVGKLVTMKVVWTACFREHHQKRRRCFRLAG